MRFYFPCARGEQPLGRVEVVAGSSQLPRLPKAFCARNVSMVWEALRVQRLVDGESPYLGWEPAPAEGQDPAVLMRGGASANLASLLAALSYEHALDFGALGHPHAIWASGELNPESETAFLQPVGEIEAKLRVFLDHCKHHGPALFIAPIGNVTEIHQLREEGGFEEHRIGGVMPVLPPLRKPTILWVGCTREQCVEFVGRLLGEPELAVRRRSRSRHVVLSLSALSIFLLSFLGYALVSSYRLRQEMAQTLLQMKQEKRAKHRAEQMLGHVRPLLQQLLLTAHQQKKSGKQRKKELTRLWRRVRRTETRLRRASVTRRHSREGAKIVQELALIQKRVAWLLAHHPSRQPKAPFADASVPPPPPPPPSEPLSPLCRGDRPGKKLIMQPTLAWQRLVRNTAFYPRFASLVAADFSPDSRTILVATHRAVELREVHTGKRKFILKGHAKALSGLSFSPQGERAVTTSYDGTARLWSMKNGRALHVLKGHKGAVLSAAFLSKYLLLTAGNDRTVRRWDVISGRLLTTHKLQWQWATYAAFSPRGTRLATANLAKHVQLWDPRYGRLIKTLRGHKERVKFVRFSRDGRFLATASIDMAVRVWDARTGQSLSKPLKHLATTITGAAFSANHRLLATTTAGAVWFWDTCAGKLKMRLRAPRPKFFLFSPDKQFVASGDAYGRLRLYHAPMAYRDH